MEFNAALQGSYLALSKCVPGAPRATIPIRAKWEGGVSGDVHGRTLAGPEEEGGSELTAARQDSVCKCSTLFSFKRATENGEDRRNSNTSKMVDYGPEGPGKAKGKGSPLQGCSLW